MVRLRADATNGHKRVDPVTAIEAVQLVRRQVVHAPAAAVAVAAVVAATPLVGVLRRTAIVAPAGPLERIGRASTQALAPTHAPWHQPAVVPASLPLAAH